MKIKINNTLKGIFYFLILVVIIIIKVNDINNYFSYKNMPNLDLIAGWGALVFFIFTSFILFKILSYKKKEKKYKLLKLIFLGFAIGLFFGILQFYVYALIFSNIFWQWGGIVGIILSAILESITGIIFAIAIFIINKIGTKYRTKLSENKELTEKKNDKKTPQEKFLENIDRVLENDKKKWWNIYF